MNKTALEKRKTGALKDKAQYVGAFGVISLMLWVAGFPVFLLLFVGVLSFFIWKVFSFEGKNETRRVFEFFLSANEILREDDRRWYGFEIQDAIGRGETILRSMPAAPPLVSFALGALYQKLDDHSSALKYLSQVVEENAPRESSIVYPTKELRDYVRMLRKIERSPADAPMTSSAIRSLERARKNRGQKLLEQSRLVLTQQAAALPENQQTLESVVEVIDLDRAYDNTTPEESFRNTTSPARSIPVSIVGSPRLPPAGISKSEAQPVDRKTISELLHDIYDKNVQ